MSFIRLVNGFWIVSTCRDSRVFDSSGPYIMISRLKTFEEERNVEVMKAYAIRTSKDDVQRFLKDISYARIPKHLKRIKAYGDVLFILVEVIDEVTDCLGRVLEMMESIVKNGFGKNICRLVHNKEDLEALLEIVDVPKYQPETKSQYLESSSIWPCFRAHKSIEGIDPEYIKKTLGVLMVESKDAKLLCCGVCIIANENGILSIHKDTDDVLGHSILEAVRNVSKSQVGYLCTGFDAFILREPCLSCSVGFVHGRIKRVFCVQKDENGSMPFSKLKINYNRSLNHRYGVYFVDEP